MFREQYGNVFKGNEQLERASRCPSGDLYAWDGNSTYIQKPPYFTGMTREAAAAHSHRGRARAGDAGR